MKYLRHIFDYLPCIFNLLRELFYTYKKKIFFAGGSFFIILFPAGFLPYPFEFILNARSFSLHGKEKDIHFYPPPIK